VGPGAGVGRCGKSRPTRIRSPDLPARSESLYRLRYPGSPSSVGIGVISRGKGQDVIFTPHLRLRMTGAVLFSPVYLNGYVLFSYILLEHGCWHVIVIPCGPDASVNCAL
jgi:hypothetical protein